MKNDANSRHKALSAAIFTALGIGASLTAQPAFAAFTGGDGDYDLVILPTATRTTTYGGTGFKFGKDGNWQSSFTFGALPGDMSNSMTDTSALVDSGQPDSIALGSSIGGDGYAGVTRLNISNGVITVQSINIDTIFATAGGDFGQYIGPVNDPGRCNPLGGAAPDPTGFPTDTSQMTGTIDAAGNMTLTPTGRLGVINAPVMCDRRWLVDDFTVPDASNWNTLSTGSATAAAGTINGALLQDVGDQNGDGVSDFQGILVSGGQVGSDWGDFFGATYFEAWRFQLLARAINDSAAVSVNTATSIDVLANDGVGSGTGPLNITSTTDGNLGTVSTDGTSVTYTAGATPGTDSFTYTTTDADGTTSTATVTVTVSGNAAVAGDDGPISGQQGNSLVIPVADLTANDTSSAGNIVASTLAPSSPSAQGGTVSSDGTNVTYVPPSADFVGSDSFTYTVQDDAATPNTTAPATVSLNISAWGLTTDGSYALGTEAVTEGSTNGRITGSGLADDAATSQSCIGGCFDFVVTGVTGTSVQVVAPPLTTPIAEGLVMRKLVGGTWQDFDTTADELASAPLTANGGCPTPADTSWVGLDGATTGSANVGHVCLRYTIADNGANDADTTPGTVADPSGLGALAQGLIESGLRRDFGGDTGGGGCTLNPAATPTRHAEWWLLGGLMGLLGWMRRRRQH